MDIVRKFQKSKFRGLFVKSSISVIFKILGIGLGYLFALLVSRKFGAEVMGVYALAFTVLRISGIFGKLGTETSIIRFVAETTGLSRTNDVYRKAIKVVVFASVLVGGLIFLLNGYLTHTFFKNPKLAYPLLIVAGGILPYALYGLNNGTLRGLKQVNTFAFFQFAFPHLAGIVLIFFLFPFSSEAAQVPILAMVLGYFLGILINYFLLNKEKQRRPVQTLSEEPLLDWKSFFDVSVPMLLASSLFLFITWTDTIMLGFFSEEQEVGIYHITLKLATLISLPLVAINTVIAPKFVEMWKQGEEQSLESHARVSSLAAFVVSFPIMLLINLFAGFVLSLFGKEFIGGSLALSILSIGYLVNASCGPVGYLMQMTGREKSYQWIIFFTAIINLVLNIYLIPKMGITGAAIATAVSLIIWNFAAVGFMYFKHDMRVAFFLPKRKSSGKPPIT